MDNYDGFSQNLQSYSKPCPNPYCHNPHCKCGAKCKCTPERPCGCSDTSSSAGLLHESVVAAVEEMRVWVILMAEHAKFIRLGLDPNPDQEHFFRMADQFAIQLEQLHYCIQQTPNTAPTQILINLREQTIQMVNQLIIFKKTLFKLLEECKGLGILPSMLVDHIRREADRFVGTLERSKSKQTKTRNQLGIPNGQTLAETVPRNLYHRLSGKQLFKVGIEETAFFSRVHGEHAHHLSMSFRPEVQENYRQQALFFEKEFANHRSQSKEVEKTGTGFEKLVREGIKISCDFNMYLQRVLNDITTCTIPTKQTNFPPLLADHMSRETVYYIDILERLHR